ncbi:MAG: four-carbon acid sugar kinase family protein, partial [Chloroflexota bacterium]|nr:four-carbon acid sugar kinase family protein [Chloroflexota bacterium]
AALAERVVERARQWRPGVLVLAGGQTARLVCEGLGVHALDLMGEVEAGMPIGRLVAGRWSGVLTVTKAGGFGAPTALLDALRRLGVSCLEEP